MITLVSNDVPIVTAGKDVTPPGMIAIPRFAIDADELERLAKKYVVGDEMQNLAHHLVKSKRELDAALEEAVPTQWSVHEERLALANGLAKLEADRKAYQEGMVEGCATIELQQVDLSKRESVTASRVAVVEAQEAELKQAERQLGLEQTALANQERQLATDRAAHELVAAPVRRKLAHLRALAEIEPVGDEEPASAAI